MKTNMTDGEKKIYNTGYSEIVVPDSKHRVVRFKFLLLRAENIFFSRTEKAAPCERDCVSSLSHKIILS